MMKKKIRVIAACLLFCIMFVECGKFLRYILVDDTTSYTRIMFHEMYAQDNIDVLFVGSSHCYRSFIPEILDEKLGLNTFNGGTSAQNLDGSYMIIKEAARYNDIKHIYLELYYDIAFADYKERTELTQTYIISDYLKPSLDKFLYLFHASTKDYYLNSFIVARRNWPDFFDADYVKDLMIKKSTDDYKNYDYAYVTDESNRYVEKGYVANNTVIEGWNYFSASGWNRINIDDFSNDWFRSLKDIIAFCDKRKIPLTLISAPMPNYLVAGVGNYDEYVELVRDIIADTNVDYYDFNLCKEEYFPNTSSLFRDSDHLNCYGAETFSYLLADLINSEISKEELFYNSYEEKIENLVPTVFGISYCDNNDNGELVRECKIVSTGNAGLEYEIIVLPEKREPYKEQNFSDNIFFTIAPEEHGLVMIQYRLGSFPEEVWTVNVSY